jgi:hypothetical protein
MFYGLDAKQQKILGHALGILNSLFGRVYHADHLITVERCMGFVEDKKFTSALDASARTAQNRSLAWRLHTLSWAASQAIHLPGDFVECGVFEGFCSHFLCEYLDFGNVEKRFILYDTFKGVPDQHRSTSPVAAGAYEVDKLLESVRDRFAPFPNVSIVQGSVPEVLAGNAPEEVCFLHLDMNSASAEVGALEILFDRVVPGGMIVLDDYGWQVYRQQKIAEDEFFAARNYRVMELPTGQGLVVKRP